MCKPKPFPRCSSHARDKRDRTKAKYNEVYRQHRALADSGADEKTLQKSAKKVLKALNASTEAWREWEETPQGLEYLQKREDEAMANENPRVALFNRQARYKAEARRDAKNKLGEQMEAAKAEQKADEERHLQKARDAEQRAAESWERSDTDGAVSQWASGMTGQLERTRAEIARNGGTAEFAALFDKDGNMVPAKLVRTQYGTAWGLLSDPDDPRSSFTGWVSESKASTPEKRAAALERKGYRIGTVKAPAGADLDAPAGATGLGGATSVYVKTYRRDGGFSKNVEVVDNGTGSAGSAPAQTSTSRRPASQVRYPPPVTPLATPQVGKVINYRPHGGSGSRLIKVTEVLDDVRDGKPGFVGKVTVGPEKGTEVWGYSSQIVR